MEGNNRETQKQTNTKSNNIIQNTSLMAAKPSSKVGQSGGGWWRATASRTSVSTWDTCSGVWGARSGVERSVEEAVTGGS